MLALGQTLAICLLLHKCYIITAGNIQVTDQAKRVEQYTGKVNDLKQKLRQLQGMLEDLNGSKDKKSNKDGVQKKPTSTTGSNLDRDSREPMKSKYDNKASRSLQEKLELLAARLVDGDRRSLKVLEKALADSRTDREDTRQTDREDTRQTDREDTRQTDRDTTGEDLGGFQEGIANDMPGRPRAADDTVRVDDDVERDVLALLRKFREQSKSKPRQLPQDDVPRYRPQQIIEEGEFGDFREQVLHAVENRLLDDLKMALHSGFTVKEIINDLEFPGEWEDSKKREIERELDTLESLRENA